MQFAERDLDKGGRCHMDEGVRLGRLEPGLPVSDVLGAEIGTLAHVYQQMPADHTSAPVDPATTQSLADKVLEVKTGPLGLGKHYYIPATAIETVTDDQVVLNQLKDDVEKAGWTTKPESLRQVT
jgi:hypothetical protein